ncbi:lycopene cyclase family protein [Prauserella muralis]|uniref:lycopene cyclase family protein n=1 Tax=Prauserella muralis TaxID=588067 RepID=UPI0011AB978C|nr:lycopene cyclase family protein [Prauserella muralis]TWE27974.1 lycopene beta-cyclase [Prauserella muralis]
MTIVIAGGGLSGLSLAAHLTRQPPAEPVLLVDDGSRPVTGAGWAWWSERPGLLDGAACRSFDHVRVHAGGRERVLGLGRYRYRYARGADLAAAVGRLTRAVPDFAARRGHVEAITSDAGRARVLVDGTPIAATWVFDSVLGPGERPREDARLVFRGWHVRTERPAFDPEVPTLFDFRTAQDGAASFVYVLPFGERHALVEHTAFAPPGTTADVPAQRAALAEYLTGVLRAGAYHVVGEEGAALPLSAAPVRRRHGAVLTIGTEAGLVKASTGYAYERIQQDSAAIARSLAVHGHPFALPRPRPRHRLFDGALLDVVTRHAGQLEKAFAALFDRTSAEPVLRFLDERTSVAEEAALFASMPAPAYVAAVARRMRA